MLGGLGSEFVQWARSTRERVHRDGVDGLQWAALVLYQDGLVNRVSRRFDVFDGENVFERDWDVLVVLDACRVDAMRRVAPEYPFVTDVEAFTSVAGHSAGWLRETFTDERAATLRETAYVTANPHSESDLDRDLLGGLDEVWTYAWDDDVGTVPPRAVTDRAVAAARSGEFDRVVAHYMQPHFPSVPHPELGSRIDPEETGWSDSVWDRLRRNEIDRETVESAYVDNLRYVLDELELLLDSVDGRVAVTADHGNAFGERGFYGHGDYIPLACVRRVPWWETEADDSGAYEPELEPPEEDADVEVTDRLAALGYVE